MKKIEFFYLMMLLEVAIVEGSCAISVTVFLYSGSLPIYYVVNDNFIEVLNELSF